MGIFRTIGTGIAWNTAGTTMAKVIGFVNIFIILSQLTVYEYGVTELTMSVVSTIGLFLLPGLTPIVIADLGVERAQRNFGKMKALFIEFFTFNMGLGIIAWAFLFFGSTYVAHLTGNDLIDYFFKIVSFLFLTSPLRVTSTMLATVFVRYADQSFFSVVEESAKCAWLILFLIVLERGAAGLLLAAVLAQVVAVVLFAPRTLSAISEFWYVTADDREPLWNILRAHRKWGVTSTYVGTLTGNIRLWIIKALIGTEAVGLFAFAFGIFGHIASIISLHPAIAPIVPRYAHEIPKLGRLMSIAVKYQATISIVAAVASILCAAWFVSVLFPHYMPAIPLLLIIIVALIPNGIAHISSPVFTALKEQRTILYSSLLKMTSMLILLPVAILTLGLVGAGIEFIITMAIVAAERIYRLRRFLPDFSFSVAAARTFSDEERQFINALTHRLGTYGIYPFSVRQKEDT